MDHDFKTPFPFCSLCATWHAKDEHIHPMWASAPRRDADRCFYVGFALGVYAALMAVLIVKAFV